MRARLVALIALGLAGCATQPAVRPVVVTFDDGVVRYDGAVDPASFDRIIAEAKGRPVHTLRIRSGGGVVESAIAIARWVHRGGIDVVVDGPCFSSCANYIFPAGKRKTIVGEGIVGWHGTIEHLLWKYGPGGPSAGKQDVRAMAPVAAMERTFYAEIGHNGYIAWFGKLPPYQARNLYFLSPEDMAYFGMTGLTVREDYLRSNLKRWNAVEPGTLTLLTVDRSVTNPGDPRWTAR